MGTGLKREDAVRVFAELGARLEGFGGDPDSRRVIARAAAANEWFSPREIVGAVRAVREQMLDREKLERWLAGYPKAGRGMGDGSAVRTREGVTGSCGTDDESAPRTRNVGVVMAGNIPLVGFFDLLCVLAAGHRCLVKPSSKDAVLMEYVISLLRDIEPGIGISPLGNAEPNTVTATLGQAAPATGIAPLEDATPDAVIATGSDNTNRYFRSAYAGIPSLLRGSRTSAALLTGDETTTEIDALAADIFSYSGLGCRNVSHLLLPNGYDVERLAARLSAHGCPSPKYRNNYLQRSAMARMRGERPTDGGFFILTHSDSFSACLSEVTYHFYPSQEEARRWLSDRDPKIQCVVERAGRDDGAHTGESEAGQTLAPTQTSDHPTAPTPRPETVAANLPSPHPRAVKPGHTQRPSLTDYADDVDTMDFLTSL